MSSSEAIAEEVPSEAFVTSEARGLSVIRDRHRDRDFALRRGLLVADCVALFVAFTLALMTSPFRETPLLDSLWLLLVIPLWVILIRSYGLYKRPVRRFEPTHLDDIGSLFHVLLIGMIGLWLYYKAIPVRDLTFERILIFGILALPLIAALRVVVRLVNLRLVGPERVFVVAPIEDVRMLRRKLRHHPEYEMALVGAVTGDGASEELGLPLSADLDQIDSLIASQQVDHLVVQLNADYLPQERLVEMMRACHRAGIRFGAFPAVKSLLLPGVEINHIEGMGFLTYHPPVLSRSSALMKRGMDVVGSALLLTCLAPLLALIAAAVKLDSKGDVLFWQVRVGKDGKRFRLAKFRTMVPEAEEMTADLMEQSIDPDWLILEEDPRVTPVGRFLRRNSLDELPQLWHVLKGEMSLVGPRPLSERDDAEVRGWERNRLDLVPGLTGYWQVLGRNNIPFREMVEIDYAYVTNWSMWHDLKLLARTVPAVLRRRGAN